MAVQQPIALRHNQRLVGSTAEVIIDGPLPEQPGVFVGRIATQAPEIDGVTYVTDTGRGLKVGDLVRCDIVANQGYDLIAATL